MNLAVELDGETPSIRLIARDPRPQFVLAKHEHCLALIIYEDRCR